MIERALDSGLPVLQTYGMTESCSQVATVEPGAARTALGTAGRPLDGFIVTIVDGEIMIDGPSVSPGYLGEPPRSGPHRTGDLGRFDDDGRLIVVGRRNDMIITGGENVHPSAVEAAIEELAAVRGAVVFGIDDDEWGQAVVAVIEADPGVERSVPEALTGRLARHEIPKRCIAVEHLPLLPNGKVDRRSVIETGIEGPSRAGPAT
jgi:O-succinylbenzoic acid--CoA ligase